MVTFRHNRHNKNYHQKERNGRKTHNRGLHPNHHLSCCGTSVGCRALCLAFAEVGPDREEESGGGPKGDAERDNQIHGEGHQMGIWGMRDTENCGRCRGMDSQRREQDRRCLQGGERFRKGSGNRVQHRNGTHPLHSHVLGILHKLSSVRNVHGYDEGEGRVYSTERLPGNRPLRRCGRHRGWDNHDERHDELL